MGLSGALVCQSQKYGDINLGTGAIVIGLASIVIGEVLMGRLTSFYWKLTSVVVGSVTYFVIRALVLRMGLDANDHEASLGYYCGAGPQLPRCTVEIQAEKRIYGGRRRGMLTITNVRKTF